MKDFIDESGTQNAKFLYFFIAGDIDDSVFIVQSGKLNVLINNSDGTTLSLKHVRRGESVTSLLSFIDVLAVSFHLCALIRFNN